MTTFLILLAVLAFCGGIFTPRSIHGPHGETSMRSAKIGLNFAGLFLFIVASIVAGYYQVPAGYQGILIQQGAVHGSLDAGPHFVLPFAQSVDLMEIRTQKEEADAAAASRDLQNVRTQVAINFHVDPKGAMDLYKNVGPSFASRIIDPAVQEMVKAVVARYSAEELIRNRQTVKSELDSGLTTRLRPYSIVIESGGVSLKDFQFSEAFNNAIEQKQVAQQTAEQAKYRLQQAKIDAETKVTEAKGQAEANRIRAQALNANGGSKVLAQQWIEAWEKGGSQVPTVITGGNGSGFMMNFNDLLKNTKPEKKGPQD